MQNEKPVLKNKVYIAGANVTSFIGISPGAIHFYVSIHYNDGKEYCRTEDLEHPLTASEAKEMNKNEWRDGSMYKRKPGEMYYGFWTRKDAEEAAVKWIKENLPDVKIVIADKSTRGSVERCLWCVYPKVMKRINELQAEADKLGYYSGKDDARMEKIDNEYDKLVKKVIEKNLR